VSKPKILLFDIEASNLSANFGFAICVGYKWLGNKKVYCPSVLDFKNSFKKDCTNDKELMLALEPVFDQADGIISWYGSRYDMPFLQTRRLMHDLQPLKIAPHIDAWRIARNHLKFTSNRLETVSRSIPAIKDHKTPLNSSSWIKGAAGHKASIHYIIEHCKKDVLVLEETFLKLKPFATNLPNFSMLSGVRQCPSCGSSNYTHQGIRANHRTLQAQLKCKDCGHWFLMPLKRLSEYK